MKSNRNGFTLVELLIAMAISSIVLGVIVVTYQSQAKTHMTQQEVVGMHQNARAAMDLMTREIRTVGLDPTGNGGAGVYSGGAQAGYLHFSRDFTVSRLNGQDDDSDGEVDETDEWADGTIGTTGGEDIDYRLSNDSDGDGVADGFPCTLQRKSLPLAENIEVLNFVYLDADGGVIASPVPDARLADIRSIQVTLIARTDDPVMMRKASDSNVYRNQQGTVLLDKSSNPDTVRRILLTTEVRCRNMGLLN